MITISPILDNSLIEAHSRGDPNWKHSLQSVLDEHSDLNLSVFSFGHDQSNAAVQYEATADYLAANLDKAVAYVTPYLPANLDVKHRLRVILVPGTSRCFGLTPGIQIFGLAPAAEHWEALLFLSHIFFHDVGHYGYTKNCMRVEKSQETLSDLHSWLRLLIRNEGLANYAVLDALLEKADNNPEYKFCYFSYAPWIGDDNYLTAAMYWLEQALTDYSSDTDLANLLGRIKRSGVPAVNLIGIAMARAIAADTGNSVLASYAVVDPSLFFANYAKLNLPGSRVSTCLTALADQSIE